MIGLRTLLLADYVNVFPKPVLVGVFDVVFASRDLIGTLRPMPLHYLYAHLHCDTMDGAAHVIRMRFLDDDARELRCDELQMTFASGVAARGLTAYLALQIREFTVPDFGDYTWEISTGGVVLGSTTFAVLAPPENSTVIAPC